MSRLQNDEKSLNILSREAYISFGHEILERNKDKEGHVLFTLYLPCLLKS